MAPKPTELSDKDIKRNSTMHSRIYPDTDGDTIVISGIAGKFPNCDNVNEYEYKLFNKIDMVDEREERWRHFLHEIPKRGGKIRNIEKFDATFFGVNYKQAHTMDPQSRLLMESAYEAVIDAGVNPKSLRGSKTGVYIGTCISEAEKTWFYEKIAPNGFGITGCSRAMMPNRISYSMGLIGPSLALDTACSSSMYALDSAFSALRNGEIDSAIVGGCNLTLHPMVTLQFARLGVLATDGYCRPFDSKASGYTRSEAISCIFLQRKSIAKRVYAELVYSKTNCDGYKSEGITFPSSSVQEKLLSEFYKEIDIPLNDLGYLEAHSTGTVVGDPQECRAIDAAICSKRTEPLLVGSVKSNIGHAEPASGICSVVKVCLAYHNNRIPPNINIDTLRTEIDALGSGRLQVVKEVKTLEKPYIAINSFGFGGGNAHALFKSPNTTNRRKGVPDDNIPRLVLWAGRTQEGVNVVLDEVEKSSLDAEFVALLNEIQREDVTGMVFRGFGVFGKGNGEVEPYTKCYNRVVEHYTGVKRPLVWVFSGMGSQWTAMGESLMTIPLFRKSIEECHELLKPFGLNLIDIITSKDPSTFLNIIHSFVGIAATQIGLVDMMRALNVEPDYIIGHSVGELGCGYADGCLTRKQMILAAYYRGRVSTDTEKIKGSMAAVGLGYKKILGLLPDRIEVACHNSAESCTISGPAEDVGNFVTELKAQGIFAKEVPSSNIAFHSRYISQMGPELLKYLKTVIPEPKQRSSKWLSTSVPNHDWNGPGCNQCSAEYYTNNLLKSVLFEETFAVLPMDAMTIEFAPHGLLQAILKRSMPGGIHLSLTQRGNENNAVFLLSAIGKLFNNGLNFPLEVLYPKVEFPVSSGTSNISSLIRWDHGEDWFVTKYENMTTKCNGEREIKVKLGEKEFDYIAGHVIDGKILIPATTYLMFVWETFSLMYHGQNFAEYPVQFEDIKFIRATNIVQDEAVVLNVMIHYGSGNFEITESGNLVVSGRISVIEQPAPPTIPDYVVNRNCTVLNTKDFYKELKLRGYHYSGLFRGVREACSDSMHARIQWQFNFPAFMDALLQVHILAVDSRSLLLPTKIGKIRIIGSHHLNEVQKMDQSNILMDVFVDRDENRIVCGGIEIFDLEASLVQRRKSPGIPVLEKYQFLPQFPAPELSLADAVRIAVQLSLENTPTMKWKVVEVDTDGVNELLIPNFVEAVEDLPLIAGNFILLTEKNRREPIPGVTFDNGKLITQSNCNFIVLGENSNELINSTAEKCLTKHGYLILREKNVNMNEAIDVAKLKVPSNFRLITVLPLHNMDETLLVLQLIDMSMLPSTPTVVEITDKDPDFKWIDNVKASIKNNQQTVLYSFNEKLNGLIGLVNCLRREPDGNLITCFYIDDSSAPPFDLTHPMYKSQYARGLAMNVYRNGQWGSYRHKLLKIDYVPECRTDHIFANVLHRGDLSSIHWIKGALAQKDCRIRTAYAALNFRDVMITTGRLQMEDIESNRLENEFVMGMEFSGVDITTGRRVMCMVLKGAASSYNTEKPDLMLDVPDHWSLKEAASVPVVYLTVYYAFFVKADITKGKSILIHAGTGGIGLAAIRTALAYKLQVFTTCGTLKKKQFLLEMFPELKESHIGNSRDTSFEAMIRTETNGAGVDFVLNSLAEEKLFASMRCLAAGGHFLEIGKFDIMNDNKIGMKTFLKEIAFHGIMADRLISASDDRIEYLKHLINKDIANGIIQPLPCTTFSPSEIEQAFRYMASGKHIGKVLIQLRENENASATLPVCVLNQVYFNSQLSYIIPGGLGGFGLELADWMMLRGARKIVLSSSRGITKGYQAYRIDLWKTYGVQTLVSRSDITTKAGCLSLLKEAESLGPIGGIFNLAVVLRDGIFMNQSKQLFLESFGPKAVATKYLDELSRGLCPHLEHFVVFSSVSCGRGNAGQTNYGMSNSIMERIIESRVEAGYPGKAIQWGAVGEVGLVADMAEEAIDIEIGGTLQQRIASCLRELDTMLTVPDPVVASMVVAEKRVSQAKEGIVETVMSIMAIRDMKSLSVGTTLSEIGMDSLMAVEIKQRLERDFELVLTPQDLRSLTFQKLMEYEAVRKSENSENVKKILSSEDHMQGIDLLLRNLGDESNCHEILLPLTTSTVDSLQSASPIIIIPGLEGTAGHAWYNLAKEIKGKAMLLQLHEFVDETTEYGIARRCLKHVKSQLKMTQPFYIVAYSFGVNVAIELAAMLEEAGFSGQLMYIDGAPQFVHKIALAQLNSEISDISLYDILFPNIVHTFFPEEAKENTATEFQLLETIEQKFELFSKYISKQDLYTREYSCTLVRAIYNRIRMILNYDFKRIPKLNSPIALIRPGKVSVRDIEDDYCLSQITNGKVVMKVIDGNHSSMLENPILPQLINNFHPLTSNNKNFDN